jgi:hypothetical protein
MVLDRSNLSVQILVGSNHPSMTRAMRQAAAGEWVLAGFTNLKRPKADALSAMTSSRIIDILYPSPTQLLF